MAVYTEVSDEALADYLKDFDLGKVLSFKGIAGGVENTNYLLHMTSGDYILTLYEKRVAEADLPFFVGLMDHLSAQGFPCPKPIQRPGGSVLGTVCGRPAAMVSFLEGMEVSHPKPSHCKMAGETMARLHATAADFKLQRKNALAPDNWPTLIASCIDRANEVEPGLTDLITSEMEYLAQNWPLDLPTGVIHADMFKDNVFFLDNELSGVIDFYFACNDLLAYDLAIAINAWCFDDAFRFLPELSAALIEGYSQMRKLSAQECDAIPVLARGAALRFLLTRVNDWLNVPPGALVQPHDPTAFSARLRFHRQAEGPATYGVT
ncbi:MAG: homoserine kinase [Pseudomonadota bacterium]